MTQKPGSAQVRVGTPTKILLGTPLFTSPPRHIYARATAAPAKGVWGPTRGKARSGDMSVDDERATRDAVTAGVEAACNVLSAKRKRDEDSLEEQRLKFSEEMDKTRADAERLAGFVREGAAKEGAEILRAARAERAALDAEKAAMERTHTFPTSKIKLDVGGRAYTRPLLSST